MIEGIPLFAAAGAVVTGLISGGSLFSVFVKKLRRSQSSRKLDLGPVHGLTFSEPLTKEKEEQLAARLDNLEH